MSVLEKCAKSLRKPVHNFDRQGNKLIDEVRCARDSRWCRNMKTAGQRARNKDGITQRATMEHEDFIVQAIRPEWREVVEGINMSEWLKRTRNDVNGFLITKGFPTDPRRKPVSKSVGL